MEELYAFVDDLAGAANDEWARKVSIIFDQENRQYVAPVVEEPKGPGARRRAESVEDLRVKLLLGLYFHDRAGSEGP